MRGSPSPLLPPSPSSQRDRGPRLQVHGARVDGRGAPGDARAARRAGHLPRASWVVKGDGEGRQEEGRAACGCQHSPLPSTRCPPLRSPSFLAAMGPGAPVEQPHPHPRRRRCYWGSVACRISEAEVALWQGCDMCSAASASGWPTVMARVPDAAAQAASWLLRWPAAGAGDERSE